MDCIEDTLENKKHKEEQKLRMISYVVGNNDSRGKKINEIYAKGEEYVVYSVENDDESVFVQIDTVYQEDIRGTMARYQRIMPEAFRYKNIKYKAENIDMYHSTFALAISIALDYDHTEDEKAIENKVRQAKDILNSAIDQYDKYYAERLKGKFFYFLVCLGYALLFILTSTIIYFHRDADIVKLNIKWFQIFGCGSFALIGGLISTIIKLPNLTFEKGISIGFYAVYAFERMILAFFCGCIVWVLSMSNIAFGFLQNTDYWPLLATSVIAGFTENFVPELITKSHTNIQSLQKGK